jgi:hypothetical protein
MNARRALEEVINRKFDLGGPEEPAGAPSPAAKPKRPVVNGPKVMRMNAKCSDLFTAQFDDAAGNTIGEYDGYVPDFMPGEHYGDYVELDIDLQTGQILNWKAPNASQIRALIARPRTAPTPTSSPYWP